jgi:hypothetical protein
LNRQDAKKHRKEFLSYLGVLAVKILCISLLVRFLQYTVARLFYPEGVEVNTQGVKHVGFVLV